MSYERELGFVLSLLLVASLLLCWQIISYFELVSAIYLPAPLTVFSALQAGLSSGELFKRVFVTVAHLAYGWFLASVGGIALGSLIGSSESTRRALMPTLEFIRPLPASAIFPVAIAIVGLSQSMILIVIAFGSVWPTLLATINGFATVKVRLQEFARIIGLTRARYLTSIVLPNALPDIFSGMRVSLTIALILTVTGEMLSSSPGLGFWIMLQARQFRTDDVFAGVVLLGLIGYASAQLLSYLERTTLRWRISE